MKIKMLKSIPLSVDGINVAKPPIGAELDAPAGLAKSLIERGIAKAATMSRAGNVNVISKEDMKNLPDENKIVSPEETKADIPISEIEKVLGKKIAVILNEAGYDELESIMVLSIEELMEINGIGERTAKKIKKNIHKCFSEE